MGAILVSNHYLCANQFINHYKERSERMTAIELKMSLLQEVMSLEDEQLIKKALDSVRRMKMAAFGKTASAEKVVDDYAEPTKEEILAGLKEALQDVKD